MLGDAVEFPARGESALATLLIGGSLTFLAAALWTVGLALSILLIGLFVLPFALGASALVRGYFVGVLRSRTEGSGEPPTFADWRALFADGLSSLAIGVVYALPTLVLVVGSVVVLVALDLALSGPTGEAAVTAVAVLSAGSIVLTIALYSYLEPIALAVYARENRLGSAFSPREIGRIALRPVYLIAWLLAALVAVVGYAVALPLAPLLVGFFLLFYVDVVRYALYATGIDRALSGTDRLAGDDTIEESGFSPATAHVVELASGDRPNTECGDSEECHASEGVSGGGSSDVSANGDRDWPDWDHTGR
jgi:hypothetical protein